MPSADLSPGGFPLGEKNTAKMEENIVKREETSLCSLMIKRFFESPGRQDATEEEIIRDLSWAWRIIIGRSLLEMFLTGEVTIDHSKNGHLRISRDSGRPPW
jgi:hypothetical protein